MHNVEENRNSNAIVPRTLVCRQLSLAVTQTTAINLRRGCHCRCAKNLPLITRCTCGCTKSAAATSSQHTLLHWQIARNAADIRADTAVFGKPAALLNASAAAAMW